MRSGQVFELDVDGRAAFERLASVGEKFPRIESLKHASGTTTGVLHLQRMQGGTAEHLVCHFKFVKKTKLIYVVGSADSRKLAYAVLRQESAIGDLIQQHTISNEHLVGGVFAQLKKANPRNIIRRIDVEFSVGGIDYHNDVPLYRISYELVNGKCASTHRAFEEFVQNAASVKVRFGVASLSTIIPDNGKLTIMNMDTKFALSVYIDIEPGDWYDMLDYLVEAGASAG